MPTTPRRTSCMQHLTTLLLGLVLACGIAFVNGAPEASWIGFAVAAMYAEPPRARSCLARFARPSGR